MALKDLKTKIRATGRTNKVTKAMEAVSAVKMRKSQQVALRGRPYARAALHILSRISSGKLSHPVFIPRKVARVLLIIITSDKGLAGNLNAGVLKMTEQALLSRHISPENVTVYAIGRKGYDYCVRRGYTILGYVENRRDDVTPDDFTLPGEQAFRLFGSGAVDEVLVAYTNFRSTFEQRPEIRTMLPFSMEALEKLVHDITPSTGVWSDTSSDTPPPQYMFEPNEEVVLEALLPKLAKISLYHLLLESKASEHSARMVAMKNASDKSREMQKDLLRSFNKARQGLITREVSEIIGGIEAMSN